MGAGNPNNAAGGGSPSPDTSNYAQPYQPAGGGSASTPRPMGSGNKQASNPQSPPPGAMNGYAEPYVGPVGVNPAAFNGPMGNNPQAPRDIPTMLPTPAVQPSAPVNPTPAVSMPQRGPGSGYGDGGNDFFGRRGFDPNTPPDRLPQREDRFRFGPFGPFGRREPPPGVPTWSQQGGVFNYDPNGRPPGSSPWERMMSRGTPFTPPEPGHLRQQLQERMAQMQAGQMPTIPAGGLSSILPGNGDGTLQSLYSDFLNSAKKTSE